MAQQGHMVSSSKYIVEPVPSVVHLWGAVKVQGCALGDLLTPREVGEVDRGLQFLVVSLHQFNKRTAEALERGAKGVGPAMPGQFRTGTLGEEIKAKLDKYEIQLRDSKLV